MTKTTLTSKKIIYEISVEELIDFFCKEYKINENSIYDTICDSDGLKIVIEESTNVTEDN